MFSELPRLLFEILEAFIKLTESQSSHEFKNPGLLQLEQLFKECQAHVISAI